METTATREEFVCLNCGDILVQHHCKVRCPRCGYFEDCSDGGNDHPNVYQS